MNLPSTDEWDRCLLVPEARELARDWIDSRGSHPNATTERLDRLIAVSPESAFLAVLALVRLIESEELMYYFAAGPLEDFLGRHGERFIDPIHAIALRERRLRVFLGGVWEGSMSKSVWRRIEALADHPTQLGAWDSGLSNP